MGLFGAYVAYSLGRRAERKNARRDHWVRYGEYDECSECGYAEEKHDDEGNCPTY